MFLDHNFLHGVLMLAWTFTQAKISGCENKVFIGGSEFFCQCYTVQFRTNIHRKPHKIPGGGGGGGEMQKPFKVFAFHLKSLMSLP